MIYLKAWLALKDCERLLGLVYKCVIINKYKLHQW